MQRQMAWQERLQNEDHMKALMQDGHRERIQAQIDRERERQQQEQEMIAKAREAKKKISKELQERIEENQKREKEKEENRINAMKQRREHREAIEAQRQKEMEETQKRREVGFYKADCLLSIRRGERWGFIKLIAYFLFPSL